MIINPATILNSFEKNNKTLPIGLQIICGKNEDEKAVEIALALENYLGEPQLPDVSKFL